MANALYCKVVGGVVVAREYKNNPIVANDGEGNPIWRPYVSAARPTFDPATHHAPVATDVISDSAVTQTWADPVAKTAQELDDVFTARALEAANGDLAKLLKLLMTGQFAIVNEVQALKSANALTPDQYLTWLSGLPTMPNNKFVAKMKELLESV